MPCARLRVRTRTWTARCTICWAYAYSWRASATTCRPSWQTPRTPWRTCRRATSPPTLPSHSSAPISRPGSERRTTNSRTCGKPFDGDRGVLFHTRLYKIYEVYKHSQLWLCRLNLNLGRIHKCQNECMRNLVQKHFIEINKWLKHSYNKAIQGFSRNIYTVQILKWENNNKL